MHARGVVIMKVNEHREECCSGIAPTYMYISPTSTQIHLIGGMHVRATIVLPCAITPPLGHLAVIIAEIDATLK